MCAKKWKKKWSLKSNTMHYKDISYDSINDADQFRFRSQCFMVEKYKNLINAYRLRRCLSHDLCHKFSLFLCAQ